MLAPRVLLHREPGHARVVPKELEQRCNHFGRRCSIKVPQTARKTAQPRMLGRFVEFVAPLPQCTWGSCLLLPARWSLSRLQGVRTRHPPSCVILHADRSNLMLPLCPPSNLLRHARPASQFFALLDGARGDLQQAPAAVRPAVLRHRQLLNLSTPMALPTPNFQGEGREQGDPWMPNLYSLAAPAWCLFENFEIGIIPTTHPPTLRSATCGQHGVQRGPSAGCRFGQSTRPRRGGVRGGVDHPPHHRAGFGGVHCWPRSGCSSRPALQEVHTSLQDGEAVFAFLDDVHVVALPDRAKCCMQRLKMRHEGMHMYICNSCQHTYLECSRRGTCEHWRPSTIAFVGHVCHAAAAREI